ncbi:cytochrome c biogenesis protein [Phaeocystidibacter marisrubri]|uniref:Heme exporter protein C n=1 Tax=Phaeocystidibacter marisrubri TaxID=1577780 RepID=A0A6L3ZKE7_9FLAO|nr:cytochrome c biogenesis protein CcsA [Phaeocystidibacter marisrubri]KAB2818173.1 ABC transporter permease [Phaeocystidibacter marisrubri]
MSVKKHWWKAVGVLLVAYSIYAGFLNEVPRLDVLNESIRNLYFHVSMWFVMVPMMLVSLIFSIRFLKSQNPRFDKRASIFAETGMFFALMGLVTGSLWAKFTWGTFWTNDPKLNGTAITLLIYTAYFILRGSMNNEDQRGRLSAVYNVFAFVLMIVFIGVLPRLTDSLHPGNGGNAGFNQYDLDSRMRVVFYPAVIGWNLIGVWFAQLTFRIKTAREAIINQKEITDEILD